MLVHFVCLCVYMYIYKQAVQFFSQANLFHDYIGTLNIMPIIHIDLWLCTAVKQIMYKSSKTLWYLFHKTLLKGSQSSLTTTTEAAIH